MTHHHLTDADREEVLLRATSMLSMPHPGEKGIAGVSGGRMPSVEELRTVVATVRRVLFPGFFDSQRVEAEMRHYFIGVDIDLLYRTLRVQVRRGLLFGRTDGESGDELKRKADDIALRFIDALPELKRVLLTDVDAMFGSDPAVRNPGEVIFCYPSIQAMVHYRVAHLLLTMGVPVIPRIITELAHSATGIDIHPGACIGEHFAIDHGTGVVIGETCIIGNHVTLYQGVTLGAKNFTLDASGHPINLPRHPIIEDGVTIYSNASVLGRITVGRGAVIGGNVWVTTDVPPGARILQSRPLDS